jgi:hyperosmotically inducible periplasmic protein
MPCFVAVRFAGILLAFNLASMPVLSQETQPASTFSEDDTLRVAREVRKRLLNLTDYSVFDSLSFGVHGKAIVLHGYASRPSLKSDAEKSVKSIPGVEKVENQIEVLPNSPMDDRIRAAVYNRIYTQPALRKYNANQGSVGRAIGPGAGIAFAAGGITNTPPIGFHAIHIIVNGGHVILTGFVNNQSDADMAYIQANGTPGVFSVDNDIQFPNMPSKTGK